MSGGNCLDQSEERKEIEKRGFTNVKVILLREFQDLAGGVSNSVVNMYYALYKVHEVLSDPLFLVLQYNSPLRTLLPSLLLLCKQKYHYCVWSPPIKITLGHLSHIFGAGCQN